VERWIGEGLSPRAAAVKAMEEVTGPVIGVALVLCAVFVPCGFITGIVGEFFRQFALTIAVSTVLSAINSLTLSPALAALLLQPKGSPPDPVDRLLGLLFGWLFWGFNRFFAMITAAYAALVGLSLRICVPILLVFVALLGLTWRLLTETPVGFIPQQDKGYLIVEVTLPDGASVQRTAAIMGQIEALASREPGVVHSLGIAGQSLVLGANAANRGGMYLLPEPFARRHGPEHGPVQRRRGLHHLRLVAPIGLAPTAAARARSSQAAVAAAAAARRPCVCVDYREHRRTERRTERPAARSPARAPRSERQPRLVLPERRPERRPCSQQPQPVGRVEPPRPPTHLSRASSPRALRPSCGGARERPRTTTTGGDSVGGGGGGVSGHAKLGSGPRQDPE
jgi:hypothetical protein